MIYGHKDILLMYLRESQRQLWESSRGLFSCVWVIWLSAEDGLSWHDGKLTWFLMVVLVFSRGLHRASRGISLSWSSRRIWMKKIQTLKHLSSFCFCSMLTNFPLVQIKPYSKIHGRVQSHYITRGMDTLWIEKWGIFSIWQDSVT